ncbi:MAG TPA: hypothetical protein VIG99_19615 [Myxococcaceae bacterium]|jgi:hypothetical protein
MSRKLAVRLPLLVAMALGVWLWRSNLFPQPRELILLLPASGARVTQVEVQLYAEGGGELLAREERTFEGEAPSVLRLEIPLRRGRYPCRAFLRDASGAERALRGTADVGDERAVEIELR